MTRTGILRYGEQCIPYEVKETPSRASRIAIHVNPDGTVVVDAPPDQPDDRIAKAIQRRGRWIASHVSEARSRFRHVTPRNYVSGEQVLYLGRRYALKVVKEEGSTGEARLKGGRLEVRHQSPDRAKVKALMRLWYRSRGQHYFARRIDALSRQLPWIERAPEFRLLEMSRQWGSCTPEGEIILNPHLVKAPRDGIDYVLIHELAHLQHRDHGKEFRKLLDRHCPRWEISKRQLDAMVEQLVVE